MPGSGETPPLTLVTGGAGFIGSHLVATLLADGGRVRVLDDFSTGRRENLAPLQAEHGDRLEVIEASILDAAAVHAAMRDVRHVSHQAAHISVTDSMRRPAHSLRINVEGTAIVLQAAHEAGAEAMVLASSAAIYGEGNAGSAGGDEAVQPRRETEPPNCLSPYAVGKLAGEQLMASWRAAHGLHAVSLRYFNVYGPRQDPSSPYAAAVPIFVEKLRAHQPPVIFGDGRQTRDFVFVGDVVRANRLALAARDAGPGPFNIATGRAISVNELVATLGKLLGADADPQYAAARAGEIRHSVADISLAGTALDYAPQTSLEDGLRATLAP